MIFVKRFWNCAAQAGTFSPRTLEQTNYGIDPHQCRACRIRVELTRLLMGREWLKWLSTAVAVDVFLGKQENYHG
jgi:hypothetical protein